MRALRLPAFLSFLCLACGSASAQEHLELGTMWRFEDPPLAYLEAEYGFKPDARWFDLVRLASLRFGEGCSASFVSPRGLILTNHHCVRGNIAENQGEADWVVNGFVAKSLEDEVRLQGLTVQQLVATRDVTAQINEGIDLEGSGEGRGEAGGEAGGEGSGEGSEGGDGGGEADRAAEVERQREANVRAVLEAAKAENPELTPQVVKMFQGAVYQLYSYKIYDDIRLVCAPHLQSAHFGGDPDNFTYPRYAIDFAFCRAYEDDKPADTSAHCFKWSRTGAVEGDLVFVIGNPGSTQRLLTTAQLEHLRDERYPAVRQRIDGMLSTYRQMAKENPESEKAMRTQILAMENAQKAYGGMHAALLDDAFMARKAKAEAAFRARVDADPELRAKFGDVWDAIADLVRQRRATEQTEEHYTPGGSPLIAKAVALVRAVQRGDQQLIERAVRMPVRTSRGNEFSFVRHLERAAKALPADDPYLQAVLGGREPQAAAQHLAETSRIGDPEFVEALAAAGPAGIEASEDPAIVVARVLVPRIEARSDMLQHLEARDSLLGTRIGLALFGAYGTSVSPDATFTLRFSDGVVKGYPYNGTVAPYRTTFYGLYGRNAEFNNEHPFDLPEVWLERKDRLDLAKAVNFVSTNDSTGGNSGSPVINANRELVGLLFDGNIESLGNEFLFGREGARSVSVHVDAIMQALTVIYEADRVAAELLGDAGGDAK